MSWNVSHHTVHPSLHIQIMFLLYTALHFLTLYTAYCILHNTVGKTIQAIAMILDNRPDPKDKAQKAVWDLSDLRHDVDPKVRDLHASILSICFTLSTLS